MNKEVTMRDGTDFGAVKLPAAHERDLDYRREAEAPQAPREEATQEPQEQAEDMDEGPNEMDVVVYEIDTTDTEEDED